MQPQTTLALEYARHYAASYPAGVAFVSADAATELELLQRIARALRRYELVAEKTEAQGAPVICEMVEWLRSEALPSLPPGTLRPLELPPASARTRVGLGGVDRAWR